MKVPNYRKVKRSIVRDLLAVTDLAPAAAAALVAAAKPDFWGSVVGPEPCLLVWTNKVQEVMHDDFIDITWPACPKHPHHPLEANEVDARIVWVCQTTRETIAPVGELQRYGGS